MTLEERVRAALQYLGYSDARINEILVALAQQDATNTSSSTASTTTAAPPVPPPPEPLNDIFSADAARAIDETFVFTAQGAAGNDVIRNFDNISGDGSSSDRVDLRAVFDALGGKFSDGVNDFADRQAALHIAVGDYDGDGARDDAKLTIDGLPDFSLTFLDPTAAAAAAFHVKADPVGNFADIVIGGASSAPTQSSSTPAPQPAPTSTTSAPAPSTPPPTSSSSTTDNGLFQGKFPAHWERLDNGLNIERSQISKMTDVQLNYLHSVGVENIRLFMVPSEYLTPGQPMDPAHNSAVQGMINFMHRVNNAGMAVVLSPMGYYPNFTSNPGNQADINMHVSWWKELAGYIDTNFSYQDVFLEVFNEPFMTRAQDWWNIEDQFINGIRSVAPEFTIVANSNGRDQSLAVNGADEWDFIDALTMMKPHSDQNVVYNVHYYDPITFTSQGASWIPGFANITNRHYYSDGRSGSELGWSAAKIDGDFAKLAAWAQQYGVMTTVNEFGVMTTAPENERAAWLHDVRAAMEKYHIGWDLWELDKVYSVVQKDSQGLEVVKDLFAKSLSWGNYQDGNQLLLDSVQSSTQQDNALPPSTSNPLQTAPTSTSNPPQTAPTSEFGNGSTTPSVLSGDSEFAKEEKFTFTGADINRSFTIMKYDNLSNPDMINDQIDLRAIFEAIGGKFTDGVNDLADRQAAVHIDQTDIDHDYVSNDTRITIDGAPNFAINLIHPAAPTVESYQVGNGTGSYDDILIA